MVVCLALLACPGCQWPPGPRPAVAPPGPPKDWRPIEIDHVRVGVEKLVTVPNSGLLLPAISPDGTHVAYLTVPQDASIYLQSLMDGRGLGPVSLEVRPLEGQGAKRVVCASGAAWPAWSPDGKVLAFLAAEADGTPKVGLHDVATGTTRKLSAGGRWAITPAISPAGDRLALAVQQDTPGRFGLQVIGLATGQVAPAPAGSDAWQAWPSWREGVGLLLLRGGAEATELGRWDAADGPIAATARLAGPQTAADAFAIFAGLAHPLSPSGSSLAFFRSEGDSLAILDLASGKVSPVGQRTHAGCWLGDAHFLAATNDELLLVDVRTGQSRRLMSGRWLPLWADGAKREAIAAFASSDPATFQLLRLRLLSP